MRAAPSMLILRLAAAFLAVAALWPAFWASSAYGQQNVFAPVVTVNDAIFRSRWGGPQVDETGAISLTAANEGVRPMQDFATKLREGLHIGSLRFRPGLALGWDYSDQNSEGEATTSLQNDQSFFIAPSLGLEFARETGPWALSAQYGGSYTYFLNQDYTAGGTGDSRNPFNNTASLGIGHSGLRHTAGLGARASYGNGENIQADGYTTTFTGGATLSYDYLINEFLTAGAYASYDTTITRYEEDNQNGSDLTALRAGAYVDWLVTGKTTTGIKVEAGRLTSQIVDNTTPAPTPAPTPVPVPGARPAPTPAPTPVPVQPENEVQARQFAQALLVGAHNLTAKILIVGGLGASYTQDENIVDVDSKYTGVRPVYLLGLQFDPSEKTSLRLYTSFEGADVVPSYGLNFTWRPRVNTSLNLSLYQTQGFSLLTVDQYQVNRGFVVGIQQILFSKLTLGLSGGWQQTKSISLSSAIPDADPTEYAFALASLSWSINSWASWVATVRAQTGNQEGSIDSLNFPQTTASVGLNLLF
jgi:hypothetical protein